jgi:hypothetical protein
LPQVSLCFNTSTLAFCGELCWEKPPGRPRRNISLIPYTITTYNKTFPPAYQEKTKLNAGMDAKVALSSSLNLDMTANPDFAQVEVDRQVTNLTRFNIFFPEQRQFFLENSDLFAQFGFSRIRPFFSRQIGLYQYSGAYRLTPILFGARVSGKIDQKWRIGAMNVQTAKDQFTQNETLVQVPASNFTTVAVQRQVFGASNISAILVNKEVLPNSGVLKSTHFNRVAGVDYNLLSRDNKWSGKAFYHYSIQPEAPEDAAAHASWLMFNNLHWNWMWNHEYVGKNYKPETGFLLRKDLWRLEPSVAYRFYPKHRKINNIVPQLYYSGYYNHSYRATDHELTGNLDVNYQNTACISVSTRYQYTFLLNPFDPTGSYEGSVPGGMGYSYRDISVNANSNYRKPINYSGTVLVGEFYNGKRMNLVGNFTWRYQPYGQLTLDVDYNRLWMANYKKGFYDLLNIGPRVDATMTTNLYFTLFSQYVTQLKRMNVNARMQWRFRPMSDLFIVYTTNTVLDFTPENSRFIQGPIDRYLAVKVVLWVNP